MPNFTLGVAVLAAMSLSAGSAWAQDLGPVGPSPYEAVDGWLKPFDQGFTFGGNVGVYPESPNRIFILQRGSTQLPNPVPPGYEGNAASIGMSPQKGEGRVYRNVILVVDGTGKMIEAWSQWDQLFARTDREVGVHRIRISPYDRERRVWVIDESAHQIHVFSNDGKKLLMSLGENVSGTDKTHFGEPQDVAFLPDGRVLVADGLANPRVVVLDAQGKYLTEFGTKGTGPGQFMTVHGIAVAPDGLVLAVDRDGRQVQLFRESSGGKSDFTSVGVWKGFELPLDVVANGTDVWVSDLRQAQGHRVRPERQPAVHLVLALGRARSLSRDAHHDRRRRRQSLWQRQPGGAYAEAGAEEGRRSEAAAQTVAALATAHPNVGIPYPRGRS